MLRLISCGVALVLGLSAAAFADGHAITQSEYDAAEACPNSSRSDQRLVCACNADARSGSVWGSGPYTGDSSVCTAAAHAGALEAGVGMVVILPMGDQASFTGTTQNGVSTSNWGSYGTSFDVVRAQVQTASAQLKPQFSDAELAAAGACPGTLPIDQTSLLCACPADPAVRSVWGSGPYTADSDICSAALHAGAMGAGGGMVFTIATAGQDSYSGTSANGVTTRDWRAYGRSIAVSSATGDSTGGPSLSVLEDCSTLPTGLDVYSCFCPANDGRLRSVWGSGPYTSDSDICTAALHDGAINLQGGDVTVLRIGGLNAYAASESNGASTSAWADYTSSIVFDRN